LAGLTKNGQHDASESPIEELLKYLLLMVEHLDSTAETMRSKAVSSNLTAAVQGSAASLRQKAASLARCLPKPH
jgi:hypothetical protein